MTVETGLALAVLRMELRDAELTELEAMLAG